MGQSSSSSSSKVPAQGEISELSAEFLQHIGEMTVSRTDGSNDTVPLKEICAGRRVVLHLMRRFGCPLCRHGTREVSLGAPLFYKHNVALVGIGLERLGLEEFQKDKYWSGELYIDEGKKIYSRLGLQSKGITSGFGLLSSAVRENSKRASKAGIEGNLKGDGFQLGATYVIDENGSLLAEFKQTNYGDHPTLEELFDALDIDQKSEIEALDHDKKPICVSMNPPGEETNEADA